METKITNRKVPVARFRDSILSISDIVTQLERSIRTGCSQIHPPSRPLAHNRLIL